MRELCARNVARAARSAKSSKQGPEHITVRAQCACGTNFTMMSGAAKRSEGSTMSPRRRMVDGGKRAGDKGKESGVIGAGKNRAAGRVDGWHDVWRRALNQLPYHGTSPSVRERPTVVVPTRI